MSTEVRPSTALSAVAARLVDGLEARTAETAHEATEAIFDEIPAYRSAYDEAFFADVRRHVELHLEALVRSLRNGAPPRPDDLHFVRAPTTRRAQRRIALADFLHAFRIGLRHFWRSLRSGAHDDESRTEALTLVDPIGEYINVASTRVAEVYVEVEQLLVADGERVRRDLLEDLLGATPVRPGPRARALEAAGLAPERSCVVVTANCDAAADMARIRLAAGAIGRVSGRAASPLAVQRGDEIVAVLPVQPGDGVAFDEALRQFAAQLRGEGTVLEIGASTIVRSLRQVPDAYAEACQARATATDGDRVVSFCAMSTFDYLTLTGDATAVRMVAPEVARLIDEDLETGGALTRTLLAYADADLNVKVAAERLYVHVNTAHNRLGRIAERTGRDLRRLGDVIELLIAIKLRQTPVPAGRQDPPPG